MTLGTMRSSLSSWLATQGPSGFTSSQLNDAINFAWLEIARRLRRGEGSGTYINTATLTPNGTDNYVDLPTDMLAGLEGVTYLVDNEAKRGGLYLAPYRIVKSSEDDYVAAIVREWDSSSSSFKHRLRWGVNHVPSNEPLFLEYEARLVPLSDDADTLPTPLDRYEAQVVKAAQRMLLAEIEELDVAKDASFRRIIDGVLMDELHPTGRSGIEDYYGYDEFDLYGSW